MAEEEADERLSPSSVERSRPRARELVLDRECPRAWGDLDLDLDLDRLRRCAEDDAEALSLLRLSDRDETPFSETRREEWLELLACVSATWRGVLKTEDGVRVTCGGRGCNKG